MRRGGGSPDYRTSGIKEAAPTTRTASRAFKSLPKRLTTDGRRFPRGSSWKPTPGVYASTMAASRAQVDVDRQRRLDRHYPQHLSLLATRIRAVVEAEQAIAAREEGGRPALRQSLVDIAAVAAALVDDLDAAN